MGRILVADDEETLRSGIVMVINSCYATLAIDTVENGKDLVARAKTVDYDVIFTDNSMPRMTGLAAIPKIRKFSEVPIYLVSANMLAEEAVAAGANGYVNKIDLFRRMPEILSRHLG